jgi:hypothetical protein
MHTTTIFTHANIAAQMITGPSPRFEVLRDGVIAQTIPATRAWRAEQKAAIAAAAELAGVVVTPELVIVRDERMASRLHAVRSSFIARIGYSAKRSELTVVFTSGQVFIYTAVTMAEFNRLRAARSTGKAYHAIIRGKKAGFEVAKAA